MQAAEAITRLIDMADRVIAEHSAIFTTENYDEGGPEIDELERKQLAVTIAQAMLNSMIPVARYRVHVEIDAKQTARTKADEDRAVHEEFTACATQMYGIIGSLIGITQVKTNVRVTLWEQRKTGADMISGYQGPTKCLAYKEWLKAIVALETAPTVQ